MMARRNPYLGDQDEFLSQTMGLVRKIAERYRDFCLTRGVPFEDVISEGTIGLLQAYGRYDPHRPQAAKFEAYAQKWIRGQIATFLREKSGIVKVSRKLYERSLMISRQQLDTKSPQEIATQLGCREPEAVAALQYFRGGAVDSLHQPIGDDGATFMDHISAPDDHSIEGNQEFLDSLPVRHRTALELRMQGWSWARVARQLRIPRTRMERIVGELAAKAKTYFELPDGEVKTLMGQLTKDKFLQLKQAGNTDAEIMKMHSIGSSSSLHRLKKKWGVVGIFNNRHNRGDEVSSPPTDHDRTAESGKDMDSLRQDFGHEVMKNLELQQQLQDARNENRKLWELIDILRNRL